MHFYEYFEWLCKCKGVTIPQAYNGAGINKGTVSRWRTAFAEGTPVNPATKAAVAISRYFDVPIMFVYDMKWADGVSANEWIARGARFADLRKQYGFSDSKAATMAALPVEAVQNFENYGVPVDVSAIIVMCNSMGFDTAEIYGEDAPANNDDETYGLQGLRDEDRALLDVARGMTREQVRKMTEFARTMKGEQ